MTDPTTNPTQLRRLLVISYGRLIQNGSAGSAVMCGLVQAALAAGLQVTHVALVRAGAQREWEDSYQFSAPPGQLIQSEATYIQAFAIDSRSTGVLRKAGEYVRSFIGHFEHTALRELTHPLPSQADEAYDAVIAFEPLAVSMAKKVNAKVRLAILGDPTGRLLWHSTAPHDVASKIRALLLDISEMTYFRYRLRGGWTVGMFGSGHARVWSRALGQPVLDLRPLLPPPPPEAEAVPDRSKIVITFGGTLVSTASRESIAPLFDEILPAIGRDIGDEHFELRLIGDCPTDLRVRAEGTPGVSVIGRVASFEAELAKGHVFLLPANYPVGVRTRLCSALAAGNMCIVHSSVAYNMPELRHCRAVRFADESRAVVHAIKALIDARDLSDLRRAAIEFFRENYQADVPAAKLLEAIRSV